MESRPILEESCEQHRKWIKRLRHHNLFLSSDYHVRLFCWCSHVTKIGKLELSFVLSQKLESKWLAQTEFSSGFMFLRKICLALRVKWLFPKYHNPSFLKQRDWNEIKSICSHDVIYNKRWFIVFKKGVSIKFAFMDMGVVWRKGARI